MKHGALRGLALGLSFHVCVRLNLLILSWPLFLVGCQERFPLCPGRGRSPSPSLPPSPLFQAVMEHASTILLQSLPKRSPSPKSLLYLVSRCREAPGIPLCSFPWSLGSSLCHVAQSEPSLGRITQLSIGGQMTIIRLHSSGPYLKRQERSPGDLK